MSILNMEKPPTTQNSLPDETTISRNSKANRRREAQKKLKFTELFMGCGSNVTRPLESSRHLKQIRANLDPKILEIPIEIESSFCVGLNVCCVLVFQEFN